MRLAPVVICGRRLKADMDWPLLLSRFGALLRDEPRWFWQRATAALRTGLLTRRYHPGLDLSRRFGVGPAFLLVTHFHGGGTERHVGDLTRRLEGEGIRALVLRASDQVAYLERPRQPWRGRLSFQPSPPPQELGQILRSAGIVHAHVHQTIGFANRLDLGRLLAGLGVHYDWTVHDYQLICPRLHLNDANQRYCGEPNAAGCNRCLASHPSTAGLDIGGWRAESRQLLQGARQVFVASRDVANRLARYFPGLPCVMRPHAEPLASRTRQLPPPLRPHRPLQVGVLGTLTPLKGMALLVQCALDARRRRLPLRFHVVGNVHESRPELEAAGIRITGRYREDRVYDLIRASVIHCAFQPARIPETYSYTLSIAQAAGLIPVCFDLGAQAERIRDTGWGELLPLDLDAPGVNDRLVALRARLLAETKAPAPHFLQYPSILVDYYGLAERRAA